ncbi:MAG: hypothetical protein IKN73_00800 [Alphaproteobacteria bacterium]|nr:hypothetical protein [Alphaproteobacteria bacterium]
MFQINFKKFMSSFGVKSILLAFLAFSLVSFPAKADILDSYNLAPFIPIVLETMMNMAVNLYDFFVDNGHGIIYTLIYAFLAFYIGLYLFKMYLPKDWLSFLGFSGGGEIWDGSATGWKIADNVFKPCLRALIAIILLLQIKPTYITKFLVDPFLEFGYFYTENILKTVNSSISIDEGISCPASITDSKWISERSCNFLIRPVYAISKENNRVIKYGFDFLRQGIKGMMVLIPHGGEDLMNIITGILLITAFVSSNVFMALLIIQGIFDFCLSLIMYPFNVLAWVAKKSDKWVDFLPAFEQIIDSLKKLVITMIACAFMLCINISVVRALFNWSSSVFVAAASGVSSSNIPSITNTAMNFGSHSVLWLSSLLTIFLMQNIFKLTRERLEMYTSGTPKTLYTNVTGDAKTIWTKTKAAPKTVKDWFGVGKKIIGKK